jgi:hypothetical protein
MRKVYLDVKVKVIVEVEEGVPMDEVMSNLFVASTDINIGVVDSDFTDYEVTDSK